MTKNKFVKPPYLPLFNVEDAEKLVKILALLRRTCCAFQTPQGALDDLLRLTNRSSSIHKHDLYRMKPVVEAINGLKNIVEN